MKTNNRSGFTLVETIVAMAMLAIGIVACIGAFGTMTEADIRARDSEAMQSLAVQKVDELIAGGVSNGMPTSGDFMDRNEDKYTWTARLDTTQTTNLSAVTVTVVKRGDSSGHGSTAAKLVYVPQPTNGGATG